MLTERQEHILKTIILEYIRTAEPVGSTVLVEKQKLPVSSATVRNEMLELDEEGYLEKTHTSSGRVPTEKAYTYYLTHGFKPSSLTEKQKEAFHTSHARTREERAALKEMAKSLAEVSHEFILTAFANNDFYYTGLSYLFSKPEFTEHQIICSVSQVIDHLDNELAQLYRRMGAETAVLVGSRNPFDPTLSLIAVKPREDGPLVALLGPMRMSYQTNVGLIEHCRFMLA